MSETMITVSGGIAPHYDTVADMYPVGGILRTSNGPWWGHGYHRILETTRSTILVRRVGFLLGWWWRFLGWMT